MKEENKTSITLDFKELAKLLKVKKIENAFVQKNLGFDWDEKITFYVQK